METFVGAILFIVGVLICDVIIVKIRKEIGKPGLARRAAYAEKIAKHGETPWKKCVVLFDFEKPILIITDQAIWTPGHPETKISSQNGVRLKVKKASHTSTTTVTKGVSVAKHAAAGAVIAGEAGAIVGAISAAEKNAKGGVEKTYYGGTSKGYKVYLQDYLFPKNTNDIANNITGEASIDKIMYLDASKSLPDEEQIRTLLESDNFKQFSYKIVRIGFKSCHEGFRGYNYSLFDTHSEEDAQEVVAFIDKVAKGEDPGQLMESHRYIPHRSTSFDGFFTFLKQRNGTPY
ncbi:MAG: hypothetical protein KHX28_07975 [Oscillospiraceae bacterium]|nr:hypothetical protein [Oscillospiraceae bacterium]